MSASMESLGTATSSAADFKPEEKKVIFASSLGTVFEWYDFYLYATLAPFFAALFFPPGQRRPRRCCRPSPPTRPASSCGRSARWCSAASATWSGASTRSWSPSW